MTSDTMATRWSVDQVSQLSFHCLLTTRASPILLTLMDQVQIFFILKTRVI